MHNYSFDSLEARLNHVEVHMDALEIRIDKLEAKLDQVIELLLVDREERRAMVAILVSHDKRIIAFVNAVR